MTVMAEQNKEEIVVRSKVPLFRGGSQRTDSLSTLAWCESVDRQQAQQEWSEGKTAVAAIDSFREEAAEWIRVIQEGGEACRFEAVEGPPPPGDRPFWGHQEPCTASGPAEQPQAEAPRKHGDFL